MKRVLALFLLLSIAVSASFALESGSLTAMVNEVVQANAELSAAIGQYEATIRSAHKKMEDEVSKAFEAIDSRPYSESELDKEGQPTRKALDAREREKDQTRVDLAERLSQAVSTIQGKYGPMIGNAYRVFCSRLELLNGTQFILSTADGSLETTFDHYVESEGGWLFSVSPAGFEGAIVHGAMLGFDDIDPKGLRKYKGEALSEAVANYEAQLNDLGPLSVYSVSVRVSAEFNRDNGLLVFKVHELTFTDSTRKKSRTDIAFQEDSDEVFCESYVPFDIGQYVFALDGDQLKSYRKEESKAKTGKVLGDVGRILGSIEFYAIASGRAGIGLIPKDARTQESPLGFEFNGGVDVFARIWRLTFGVNPYYGKSFDNTVADVFYTLGFELNPDRVSDGTCFLVLRYGRDEGNRFDVAYRGMWARTPDKIFDIASYFEAGIFLYPEFGYMPGVFLGFGFGGGVGIPH